MTCSPLLPAFLPRKAAGCREDGGTGPEREAELQAAGGERICRSSHNPYEQAWLWGSEVTLRHVTKILFQEMSRASSGMSISQVWPWARTWEPFHRTGQLIPCRTEIPQDPCALLPSLHRQRGISPAPPSLPGKSKQPRARGSLMELESEEEPLLNAAANRPATPALPLRAPNPPGEKTEQEEPLAALGEAGYSWEQVEEEPLEKSEIQLQGKVGSSP
ncbi:uncharacterized protein LOC134525560 isoform X1 [Chroicocephalus ridibundus]|uniref:uncharacterized protein LOC134525560 isoform X1 n=1 Tax=Chroicocephalus ridibundus TaxID=1192867 RepID=UPI002FDE0E8D